MICDKNCSQCPYVDCIRPIGQDESDRVKEYYQLHKEERRAYYRAYRKANLEKERERDRNRTISKRKEVQYGNVAITTTARSAIRS